MPSRVIKGEINASDSLSHVSIEADLTFRALLVACDDYGRFDGRLGVLKATLFPLRDEMTAERIDRAIGELVNAGCITRYISDGRPYLAMPNWEKHRAKGRRGNASRYPDPSGASSEILGSECTSSEMHDRVGGRGTGDVVRGALYEGRGSSETRPPADAGSPPSPVLKLADDPQPPRRKRDATLAPEDLDEEQIAALWSRIWRAAPWLLVERMADVSHHCHPRWVRSEVRACLAHFRGIGEKRPDWPATCAAWLLKDDGREWKQQREAPPSALHFHQTERAPEFVPHHVAEACARAAKGAA